MRNQTENKLQQLMYEWFNNSYCLKNQNPRQIFFSVPNDGKESAEQQRKVNTGLLAGCSDFCCVINGKIYFFEVKTPIGYQSDKQKDFQARVEAHNLKYFVVRSLEQFKQIISELL